MDSVQQSIASANMAMAMAAMMLEPHRPIIEQFLAEEKRVDTIMPIINPTLWMNTERREVAALLSPLMHAAIAFLDASIAAKAKVQEIRDRAAIREPS